LRNLGLDVEPVRPIGRPPQHRPNPPSELARKGQPVRPVLPERVCGSDVTQAQPTLD
jgi:hypothetical protein